jgi:hypothetical protein
MHWFVDVHSAIIFAANNGHVQLLRALVEVGANIEDRSNNWRTPLNWASHWGHYDCVEYLVNVGANVSTFDSKGMTPLMAATLNGNPRIVQLLLDHGADPLAKNVYNGTALSIARVQNNTVLISLLEPYYPAEEEEPSPYAIMYDIILVELGKLFDILQRESIRLYGEAVVGAKYLAAEVHRRWEELQQSPAPIAQAPQSPAVTDSNQCGSSDATDSCLEKGMVSSGEQGQSQETDASDGALPVGQEEL